MKTATCKATAKINRRIRASVIRERREREESTIVKSTGVTSLDCKGESAKLVAGTRNERNEGTERKQVERIKLSDKSREMEAQRGRKRRKQQSEEDRRNEAQRGRKRRKENVESDLVNEAVRSAVRRSQQSMEDRQKETERYKQRRVQLSETDLGTEAKRSRIRRSQKTDEERRREAEEKREKRKVVDFEEKRCRALAWRLINQYASPSSPEEKEAISKVCKDYAEDLAVFESDISSPLRNKVCGVCGIRKPIHKIMHEDDEFFNCLRLLVNPSSLQGGRNWWKFCNPDWDKVQHNTIAVCIICHKSLSNEKPPLMSRACYPISLQKLPSFLEDLSELEQALISPVLPMIFIYQHHGSKSGSNGQYKSFGQSIALQNDVDAIARVLPRKPEDICLSFSNKTGVMQNVRPSVIRRALEFFRSTGHPGYADIRFSEENFLHLCEVVSRDKDLANGPLDADDDNLEDESHNSERTDHTDQAHTQLQEKVRYKDSVGATAAERLLNKGQNQAVENETAAACESVPIGAEPQQYNAVLRKATLEILSRNSPKQIHREHVTENWHLKFPFLLPDGLGGPNDCTDPSRKLSLEAWIKYVIQIEELGFHKNILFILYANNVIRRRKITGFACNKSISGGVRDAVRDLIEMIRNGSTEVNSDQHRVAVEALLNRISYHTNDITGSVQDKAFHRQNILSMYNDSRHGAPQLFVTLSAAESFWPETFVFISGGKISLEEAKNLNSNQRADMISKHPVRVTQAWKDRVAAFLKLITKGKSKPFGNILHYIWTAEWQTRLSEHIHLLIWCDSDFSNMTTEEDSDGNIRLCHNASLVTDIESFVCMQIPESDTVSDSGRMKTHEAITQARIRNLEHLVDNSQGSQESVLAQLKNLVLACNIHNCNNYCTQNFSRACKSGFPHRLRDSGEIQESVDAKQNTYYRAQLKRNDKCVNNYNVAVFNAWRANMDITALLGDAFGACVYVAYYTSKKDKSADLNRILNKIKNLEMASDDEDELKKNLNRILLAIDSCKATGAPEASSNILGYKHHYTSTTVSRILQRSFMKEAEHLRTNIIESRKSLSQNSDEQMLSSSDNEDDVAESMNLLNQQMAEIAKGHPLCEVQVKGGDGNESLSTSRYDCNHDRLTNQYMARPAPLENISHQDYYQTYQVSPRARKKDSFKVKNGQFLDESNHVVERRPEKLGWHVILDLKYRPSPNVEDEQWCAGALALHAQYRNVSDILRPGGIESLQSNTSFCSAYQYWSTKENERGSLSFPKLKMYENNMKSLQATNNNNSRPRGRTTASRVNADSSESSDNDDCSVEEKILDLGDIEDALNWSVPHLEDAKIWSGSPSLKYAVVGINNGQQEEAPCLQSHSSLSSSIADSKSHTGPIYTKKNPPEQTRPLDDEESLRAQIESGICRREVANRFKESSKKNCKTATQEYALHTATTALEDYYFRPNSSQTMILTGVAGAGKSYVSDKFSSFASLLLNDTDHPYDSPEASLARQSEQLSSQFSRTVSNLHSDNSFNSSQVIKNRVRTVAYSGAAAGVAKGFTIHHALGFSQKLSSDVLSGITELPPLKNNAALEEFWKYTKVLIIDEIYFCGAAFLYLVSQRLCQITRRFDKPFGGLFVLFIGDPQQIKPISGEPLYKYNYFYPVPGNTEDLITMKSKRRIVELSSSPGARNGFEIYGACTVYCHMPESIRLADARYQDITRRAASYDLTETDIEGLNKYVKCKEELDSERWLSAVWILPTWNDINLHHVHVTNFMAKRRGIHRVWSQTTVNSVLSQARKRQVVQTYYTQTSTDVGRDFTEPLPYIDLFPGQILCLKTNFIPSHGFYKNSRVVVVGIHYHNEERIPPAITSVEQAVEMAMHEDGYPAYDVLVRFYNPSIANDYKGVSALHATPGVFTLPWKSVQKKVGNASISVTGLHVHPANAGTGHGLQGATLLDTVAAVTTSTKQWYGWSNVAISRTKASSFALRFPVTSDIMQPQKAQAAIVCNELKRLSYLATPRDVIEKAWTGPKVTM